MKWYLYAIQKYTEFNGRATRQEYWMFALFNFIISFSILFLVALIEGMLNSTNSVANILNLIYTLFILIPSLSVGVRRIHDSGHNGWWIICPIVNFVFLLFPSETSKNKYDRKPVISLTK